jgi:hypothetical protein
LLVHETHRGVAGAAVLKCTSCTAALLLLLAQLMLLLLLLLLLLQAESLQPAL